MTHKQNCKLNSHFNKLNIIFRIRNKAVILIAAALFTAASASANDATEAVKERIGNGHPAAGNDKTQLCQGCHGEHGISSEVMIPKLGGQYAAYIAKQIEDFKSGARKHQIMSAMAATIDDADVPDIAAYFASQEQMKGASQVENPVGRNLFANGDEKRDVIACSSCHGANGKGSSTFPVIGGQHSDYLRVQLNNWRSGTRSNSPGGVMNNIAKPLTDAEIDALADYISGM